MNKFHRKLVAGLATVAFFGVLGSAQAQDPGLGAAPGYAPAQAPAYAPAPPPPPPPAYAPAPPPPPPIVASDSMSGQLGLGVGVTAGANTLIQPGATINLKYWLSDALAIMPQLQLKMSKQNGTDINWAASPSAIVLYCPLKTTSTKLSVGGGLGATFAKWGAVPPVTVPAAAPPVPPDLAQTPAAAPSSDVYIAVRLPIYVSVEHFFTKWFSMGVALQDDLVSYGKQGDVWRFDVSLDTVNTVTAAGFLFFYTD